MKNARVRWDEYLQAYFSRQTRWLKGHTHKHFTHTRRLHHFVEHRTNQCSYPSITIFLLHKIATNVHFQVAPVSEINFFKAKPGQQVPEPAPRQQGSIPTWSSDQMHSFLQHVKVNYATYITSSESSHTIQAVINYIFSISILWYTKT